MADGLVWESQPTLRDPLLIAAFSGWNDAADAATAATEWLVRHSDGQRFATIDGEEHLDYQARRPEIELSDGVVRSLTWPRHEFYAGSLDGRDVVVLRGIEPNVRWRSFCDSVTTVAEETGCTMLVTLGALLGDVPHTRPIRITGGGNDPEVTARLGLATSKYEGPTGIVGVLQDHARRTGHPAVSLWAPVPHYVAAPPNPPATRALLARVGDLAGVQLQLDGIDSLIDMWRLQVDQAVAGNDDVSEYVRELEAQVDARDAEEHGVLLDPGEGHPSGGDGGDAGDDTDDADPAQFVDDIEQFLRDQGPRPPDVSDDGS